jgi:hypothetical protein
MARLAVMGGAALFVAVAVRPDGPVGRPMPVTPEVAVWQVSMAAAVAALVVFMGPAAVLWQEVLETRQAETARRQAEAEARQVRAALLARRDARRHERWRMRAAAKSEARLAVAGATVTAGVPVGLARGDGREPGGKADGDRC